MSQVIFSKAGPLPITFNVDWPSSAPVIVAASGSAYAKTMTTMLQVEVSIRDTTIGTLQQFANPAETHLAFPTGFFDVTAVIGETTITLSAANSATITDQNDAFTVALIF